VKPNALPPDEVREAELTADDGGVPWWAWLALPPFAGPAAAMLYLRSRWEEIPMRYPVHFGWNGEPNRWVDRTEQAVFAPLLFAEGMLLLLLLMGAAVLFGSRKSVRSTAIPGIYVGTMYLMSAVFTAVGLMPLIHVPPMAFVGLALAFAVGTLVWAYRRNSDPDAPAEATPDECWTLGGIYTNAKDPAIFVQKRIYGYTINFSNVGSYVVLGGFVAGMMGLALFLRWANGG
jgi:uncharacterized membrane protein